MNTSSHRRSRSGATHGRRGSFSHTRSQRRGKFYRGRPSQRHGGSMQYGRQRQGGRKIPIFDPSAFINTHPVSAAEEQYVSKHTFDTFGLDARLVRTVAAVGLKVPTPIQDQIIPEILQGRDVIGIAETGTGKTAAFLLPLIQHTLRHPIRQTLILAPTRELALQISGELQTLSKGLRMFSVVCVGGMSIRPQIKALRHQNQFIIGTPGRILDLLKNKHLAPRAITTVVLDEADRMLDMGFIRDMRAILSLVPKERETLLFSATMTKEAKELVHDFLRNPVLISVKKKDVANTIEQDVVPYTNETKFETLIALLADSEFRRVLVFGVMKHSVEKLARQLLARGMRAESIHGNKNHNGRQRALARFKSGQVQVLVATDVAARGIHVEDVTHVINYDLPSTFEDYVHRIGRTGRATKKGKALTFVPASSLRGR